MSGELVSTGKVGGIIPHFFYDAIGRIVPGGFLLVSAIFIFSWNQRELESVRQVSRDFSVFGSALIFLAFLVAAYFVGFLLGALSYLLESIAWKPRRALTMTKVADAFGCSPDEVDALRKRFRMSFDFDLPRVEEPSGKKATQESASFTDKKARQEHDRVVQSSWLCAYYVWAVSSSLGVMTSRWDAEALASRSSLLASIVLMLASAARTFFVFYFGNRVEIELPLVFTATACASAAAYDFHRRKQVYGRFALFQALPRNPLKNDTYKPE